MTQETAPEKLAVLWTSGDLEVAQNMVFMYSKNAKKHGWWEHVQLIVWGASSRLLSENEDLQKEVSVMLEEGVEIVACKACAENYGVAADLAAMGIEVKYMGQPLSQYLKDPRWETLSI